MATFTVLKFAQATDAEEGLQRLTELDRQGHIKLHDAAIVTWPAGTAAPQIHEAIDRVGFGTLNGLFWGLLFGVIFSVPFFGIAVGVAAGAMGGAFRDYGIYGDFIERARSQLTEGTSALFVMTSEAVLDRVADGMKGLPFEIINTSLSKDQELKLREAFGQRSAR